MNEILIGKGDEAGLAPAGSATERIQAARTVGSQAGRQIFRGLLAARRFFHLPYFRARMSLGRLQGEVDYRSRRLSEPRGLAFAARYRPTSEPCESRPGTLESWLTERYCLYARSPAGRLYRAEVHHHPWPLQRAEAEMTRNDLGGPHGVELAGPPPLLHFSRRLDVVVWSPVVMAG